MKHMWFVVGAMAVSTWACAQTPWPAAQAENYPMVSDMQLVRHDQSVLLGESDMQTGVFYSFLGNTPIDKTQSLLITDAQRKGWSLQSAMHFGSKSMLAFAKGARLLDIRLTSRNEGVDALYSVALNQQPQATSVAPLQPQQQPAVQGRNSAEPPAQGRSAVPGRLGTPDFKLLSGSSGVR